MNNKYQSLFGFTIGPIVEVLMHSKKSRELWCGSYFFSLYMKELNDKLNASVDYNIITPFVGSIPKTRAGIYHDHIIGASTKNKNDTYNVIENFNKEVFENITKLIADLKNPSTHGTIKNILSDYLQTKFVVVGYPNNNPSDAQLILTIDSYLLAFESNRTFTLGESKDTCQRCNTLPSFTTEDIPFEKMNVPLCPLCYFQLFHYKNNMLKSIIGPRNFPSTGEISTTEMNIKNPLEYFSFLEENQINRELEFEDKDFKKLANQTSVKLKPYHKYMAIVNADGDSLGRFAQNYSPTNNETLSQRLFNFSLKVIEITKKYYGELIYCGGDDMLAFMPVAINGGRTTVIDYAKELSDAYATEVDKGANETSLSVGINIIYYKHPLSFGLQEAYEQERRAKQFRNSLSLQLTQHSGQVTQVPPDDNKGKIIPLKFDSPAFNDFLEMMKNILSDTIDNGGTIHQLSFPHGMLQELILVKPILVNLSSPQIDHFFANHFNEEIHRSGYGVNFIRDKIKNGYLHYGKVEVLELIIQFLRFIEFLRGEDK
ncbi:MAG: type III-B CRISPR-associated protein Cas10/Cmr2 [Bacteroidota bacterium]